MNVTTLFAFLSALAIFSGTVFLSFSNSYAVYDYKAALIVFGGTIATTFVCFPAGQVLTLFKVFWRRVMGKSRRDYDQLIKEIVLVAKASYRGPKAVQAALEEVSDYFLKDAAEIAAWTQSDVPKEKLRELLETRAMTHYRIYMSEAGIFRTISKFPPAFGLMGTTIGMIALLQSLGNATDAKDMIGPAMAVALITTLYGLALANFIFIPIAENLTKQTEEDQTSRMMVVEGVMLIRDELPTPFIEEYVRSFLLPSQRPVKDSPGGPESGARAA